MMIEWIENVHFIILTTFNLLFLNFYILSEKCPYLTIVVDPPTKCQKQYKEAVAQRLYAKGGYVPRCLPDGTFDEVQCAGGYCWCSNRSGSVNGRTRGWPSCATGG